MLTQHVSPKVLSPAYALQGVAKARALVLTQLLLGMVSGGFSSCSFAGLALHLKPSCPSKTAIRPESLPVASKNQRGDAAHYEPNSGGFRGFTHGSNYAGVSIWGPCLNVR